MTSRQQAQDALDRLAIDPLKLPRLPWDSLHDLVGPLFPQSIWGVCGPTAGGKTTVAAHVIEYWVQQKKRVYAMTLEQPANEYRIALAALSLGYHPQRCLANKWHQLPFGAEKALKAEIIRQATELEHYLIFPNLQGLGCDNLEKQFDEASLCEADVIVLDHWGMLSLEGYNDLRRFTRLLRALCTSYGIPFFALMQSGRGDKDPLRKYRPIVTDDVEGGEVIPQLMTCAIGLFRPLLETTSKDDLASVRRGQKDVTTLLVPGMVGMNIMKHRIEGEHTGKIVHLPYRHGRITDPQTDSREQQEERLGI